MQTPYQPPKDEEGITCPECGSTNVSVNENMEVKLMPSNNPLKQYVCGDCKCSFIPAMESDMTIQDHWAKKIRMTSDMNENKSWKTKKYQSIVFKTIPKKES